MELKNCYLYTAKQYLRCKDWAWLFSVMGGGFYALKNCLCQAWFMADLIKYMQEMLWVWSTVCSSRVTLWVALDTYLVLCTYRRSGTREFISAHFICLLLKLWLIVQKWLVFVSVVTGSHGWFLSSSYAKRQVSHLVSSTVQVLLIYLVWFTYKQCLMQAAWNAEMTLCSKQIPTGSCVLFCTIWLKEYSEENTDRYITVKL